MKKVLKIGVASLAVLLVAFAGYVYIVNRPLPQNEYDVPILDRTIELLGDENEWSRSDDRTCGEEKQGLSLYCALRQASMDVTGEFRHRAAALQEVRFAIEEQKPDADYAHRLMDYNNDESVGFADMHAVLQAALVGLESNWRALHDQG